jgi:hypothetical protein
MAIFLIQIFWNKLTPQNGHMLYFLYRYTFISSKMYQKSFRCLQLCKPSFPFSMLSIWCYFNLVNLLNSKATIFMNFKFHGFKLSIQLSAPSPNTVGQFTSFQVLAREEFTYFPGCFLRSKWLACTQKENQQLLHFFPKNNLPNEPNT